MKLGQRDDYTPSGRNPVTLGTAVHFDAHALQAYRRDLGYRLDGLGTSWLVRMGHQRQKSSASFERRVDEQEWRAAELRRLLDAIETLRDYDPLLHHAVVTVCLTGGARLLPQYGTRHEGAAFDRLLRERYGGKYATLYEHLKAGWGLVAVLVAEPETLAAASAARAADEKALAWATARGLVSDSG